MRAVVLMTTYNGEKYLEAQIESILSQKTSVPVDLIVRDDGSTDSTVQILEKYSNMGKLQYTTGKNLGAAKGFISLLRENPGYDFYAFSDQDDVWNEDKLQKGIDVVKDVQGPALYCTNAELVHSDLTPIGRNVHRERPTYNLVSILCLASCAQGCTSVFNKELAEIVQRYPLPKTFIMHDSLMTCLCALIGGKICYDHDPSMKYRMHGSNVLGMATAKQGKVNVINSRIAEIMKKKKISMYVQAKCLLDTYGELFCKENELMCKIVIQSEKNWGSRLKLFFDRNLKHDTFNKTVTKKITILLGND